MRKIREILRLRATARSDSVSGSGRARSMMRRWNERCILGLRTVKDVIRGGLNWVAGVGKRYAWNLVRRGSGYSLGS